MRAKKSSFLGTRYGRSMQVIYLVDKYISQKTAVRASTRINFEYLRGKIEATPIAYRRISEIRMSEAKFWTFSLQENGLGYSNIRAIHSLMRLAFQMSVEDDILTKNPFSFPLGTLVKDTSEHRNALTPAQEEAFLSFVRQDPHFSRYYDAFYILFHTGLRISEFSGLTIPDIDFQTGTIRVDHQLQKRKSQYLIEDTKTTCGTRILPMTPDVAEAFRNLIRSRKTPATEPVVDGYSRFLCLDQNGSPEVASHWEHHFTYAVRKYNKTHTVPLPKITPHICRHTFCTRMVYSGMSPKTLQYLMGHSDIRITMNLYMHNNLDDIQREVMDLAEKKAI